MALASLALSFPSRLANSAQPAALSTEPLSDSLALVSGGGCNVLAKRAANGELLVIDGGLAEHSEQLLEAIYQASGSDRISRLVNTHWHPEQTGLNLALAESPASLFAHENTRQWLSVEIARPWEERVFPPLPANARPDETFYHYGDLQHGEELVQYGYLRQAHTDGDLYMFFPEDNVLHGGGVLCNDGWPVIDWWTGGWLGGLVDALEVLLEIVDDETVIVPANGPLMNKAELQEMRDMHATIFQRIRTLFMAAESAETTVAAKPTEEFDAHWGDSRQFIILAHQSLIPHYTPDA